MGSISSGVMGFPVPGCKYGGSGLGRSGWTLYHCWGISFSLKIILYESVTFSSWENGFLFLSYHNYLLILS
jgi:hypothetical protein